MIASISCPVGPGPDALCCLRRRRGPMDVVGWLLESDPSIRWQVMRDLTGASSDAVAAERARVAGEGWGARLLSLQRADGHWDVEEPDFSSAAAARWWQSMEPGQ